MGLAGDSLQTFYLFVTLTTGAIIGAITAPKGWRTNALIVASVAFAIAAAMWLWKPTLWPWVDPLVRSGGLIPLTTITVVALMITGRRVKVGAVEVRLEPKAPPPRRHVGVADTRLEKAFAYMVDTAWAREHSATDDEIDREIRDKLHLRHLVAFGRIGADGNADPIDLDIWASVTLNPETGNAETADGEAMYFDVQFVRSDLSDIWPISHSAWAS